MPDASPIAPVLRFIVGFAASVAVVFVLSWLLMLTAVPSAEAWSRDHCLASSAEGCTLVKGFLTWWWAALLVLVVPAIFLATARVMRKLGH